MGFFDRQRQTRIARKLIAAVGSADWGVAEEAIRQIPEVLDVETALSLLLPLSRGEGGHLANPLRDLPPTLTHEFTAGVHLSSTLRALGQIEDPRATQALLAVVATLPNFASAAVTALGSPRHAAAALTLEQLYAGADKSLRFSLMDAIWKMDSDDALEAVIRIGKAHGSAFSEETTRAAWATRHDSSDVQPSATDARKQDLLARFQRKRR